LRALRLRAACGGATLRECEAFGWSPHRQRLSAVIFSGT
jgi:hypothetical protein